MDPLNEPTAQLEVVSANIVKLLDELQQRTENGFTSIKERMDAGTILLTIIGLLARASRLFEMAT